MRHFRLSLTGFLILTLTALPLAGCTSTSGGEDWRDKYETLSLENTTLKAELGTLQSDVAYLRTASETLKEEYDTLETEYNTLKAEYGTLKTTSNTLQGEYNSLKANYNTLQANYNTVKADYDTLKADSVLYDILLDAQKADYDSLKADYDTLKALYNELAQLVLSAPPVPAPTPTYTTWIDEYEATYGELPVAPDWLAPIINGLDADGRINREITLTKPSAQYWSRRSPSEKDMILELVSWLGGNPDDFEWSIGR